MSEGLTPRQQRAKIVESKIRLGKLPMCANCPDDEGQCWEIGYRWGALGGCSVIVDLCGLHYNEWNRLGLIHYGGVNKLEGLLDV